MEKQTFQKIIQEACLRNLVKVSSAVSIVFQLPVCIHRLGAYLGGRRPGSVTG